jgi:NAD(P)-dependent dehydrogenase (short-subunit alcohol dehydrogenase family)
MQVRPAVYRKAFMQIKNNVFIVTGGASGLGEGTARLLTQLGGKVVIADMQDEKGQAIAAELGGAFVHCDVSNEEQAAAVVAKAQTLGKLSGLINCAGIATAERTVGKSGPHVLAGFQRTININLIGSFNMIRNMTIAPGIFGTPMMFSMPKEVQEALAAGVPFPSRLGTPQDYAKLVVHILDNDMLNGEVIRLDGAIRLPPK